MLKKQQARQAQTPSLSRRERQIMDAIYAAGRATAAEVRQQIADPPSYSTVRALLRVLEEKGHLRHRQDGPRYVFLPTVPRETARRSALGHLLRTFFDGSTQSAVATLLDLQAQELTEADFDHLSQIIEDARKEER